MRKYVLQLFVLLLVPLTLIESAFAHEFDSLGVLVRHKENKVSLIAAPSLSVLETKANMDMQKLDTNGDGAITFTEIQQFEDQIAKIVQQMVVFTNQSGQVAKLRSFRLLEKGYENLLKISVSDNTNPKQSNSSSTENQKDLYIQIALSFEWDEAPQFIRLSYDLLNEGNKNILIRNQNIGESEVVVLEASEPSIAVFPIGNGTAGNSKPIWVLGIEHVLAGLDHILFILTLVLVCKSIRGLVVPLSAFTLAHSIALALIVLGVDINIPGALIEAGIALTIVIMALFEIFGRKPTRLYLLTAAMGIIHGFGLGQAMLDSIGGIEDWVMALVQVTIGVELAQLAVALIIFAVFVHLPKLAKLEMKRMDICVSSLVACVGIFWTIERVLAYG